MECARAVLPNPSTVCRQPVVSLKLVGDLATGSHRPRSWLSTASHAISQRSLPLLQFAHSASPGHPMDLPGTGRHMETSNSMTWLPGCTLSQQQLPAQLLIHRFHIAITQLHRLRLLP